MSRLVRIIKSGKSLDMVTKTEPLLVMGKWKYRLLFGLCFYIFFRIFFTFIWPAAILFSAFGGYLLEILYRKLLGLFVGKSFFYKSLHASTVEVLYYYPWYQIYVGTVVAVGELIEAVRRDTRLIVVEEKKVQSDVIIRKFRLEGKLWSGLKFGFPGIVNSVFYYGHLPIPFLPFQVDYKTVSITIKDDDFAKKIFSKFPVSGYRTNGWSSNHFLGYARRIESCREIKVSEYDDVVRLTTASPPGFSQLLRSTKGVIKEFLDGEHAEEFLSGTDEGRIHFGKSRDSEIVFPLMFYQNKGKVLCKSTNYSEVLSEIESRKELISIIFPILVVNRTNHLSKEWAETPSKNISGFVIGKHNGKLVCVTVSSFSWIRIRVNELFGLLEPVLSKYGIEMIYYVHTDDGGAVGERVRIEADKSLCLSPSVGHGISSLVGFVKIDDFILSIESDI